MHETTGRNAPSAAEIAGFAKQHGVDLRIIELDVISQELVNAAIAKIIFDNGRLEVVVHNAEHSCYGPAEAFTVKQLAELYDTSVLSTQRQPRSSLQAS